MSTTADSGVRQPVRPGRLLLDQLVHSVRDLWRSRIVFVFTFLFPLTWLVVLGFVIGNAEVDDGSGVRMMQYVTPTAAVMGILYGTFPTVASSLADAREHGVLKRIHGTPLPAWAYLCGRIGAALVFAVGSLVTMLGFGILVYDVQLVEQTLLATTVTCIVAIICFSTVGLAVATLARSASVAQAGSIAAAVVLAFVSGVLAFGDLPAWADRFASVFPLKHFNDAVQEQFDPVSPGTGWDVGALLFLGAWTVAAAVVAVRNFQWEPAPAKAARPGSAEAAGHANHGAVAVRLEAEAPGRPSPARLLLAEVAWATRQTMRDPGWVFFAIAMPVGLYAFVAAVTSGNAPGGGVPDNLALASGMIAWGAAVTAFVNLPEAIAVARDRGALKRLRGTPLSPALFLVGRLTSALAVSLATGAAVLLVGTTAFDLAISASGVPLAVLVLLLGAVSLSMGGLALANVLPSSKAVTAVGLGVLLPLAFFSDVFGFGGENPSWMDTVGSLFPLKHMADAVAAALDPSGVSVSAVSVLVLVLWLVVLGLVTLRTFRWSNRP